MQDGLADSDTGATARALDLLGRARGHQPEVRGTLTGLARDAGGTLVGLEHEFKSQVSLARKLTKMMHEDGLTLDQAAAVTKDALRYTMQFDTDGYTIGVDMAVRGLVTRGYQVQVANTWRRGAAYMGINVAVRTKT